ncbi:MAG: histidine phosphatase family protein, partial [Deltaproteobacteria bacterium]
MVQRRAAAPKPGQANVHRSMAPRCVRRRLGRQPSALRARRLCRRPPGPSLGAAAQLTAGAQPCALGPMSLTLHFLRHGQTAGSRDQLFCGGDYDIDLTEEGQAMAQAFAAHYRTFVWQAIYCSTLRRAVATATPICEAQKVAPQRREALREIGYGLWDGHTIGEVDAAHHDAHVRWLADPAWNAPTGGETAIAVATRVLGFVDEVRQAHSSGHVLAVAHKATIRIALCSLLGI